jgi:hypothetical protein
MSAKTFTLELDKWFKDEVEGKIVQITRMIGLEVLKRVILKTPVDTGRARGNWFVAIGAPSAAVNGKPDKTGQGALNAGSAVITGLTEAQAIYLTNNLPYIGRLEAGSSQQAPAGMVAITIAELDAFFSQVKS